MAAGDEARRHRAGAAPGLRPVAPLAVAVALGGCGSGGSGTAAVRHFESGPGIERITRDLEAIDEGCRLPAGPAALRAARDLGALIEAGPDDTYGPASASQTLAQLGRIAARRAPAPTRPNYGRRSAASAAEPRRELRPARAPTRRRLTGAPPPIRRRPIAGTGRRGRTRG